MTWNLHIDAALKKAARRLSNIRKIRFIITRKASETLYKSLVLPLLEYGSILFDGCTLYLKQRLESSHRQAAIVCTCAFRNTSYDKLLTELGRNSLDEYIAILSDNDIVQLFLYGDLALSNTFNYDIFSMAYIINTTRFSFGGKLR